MTPLPRHILGLALVCGLAGTTPAAAHPHILATVRAEIIYDEAGAFRALRQSWSYDAAFSAFAMREIDADRDGRASEDELAAYARTQVAALGEFGHFTALTVDGRAAPFAAPRDYGIRHDESGRLTLSMTLPLQQPAASPREIVVEIFDPNFFAYFTLAPLGGVLLTGAPYSCTHAARSPAPIDLTNTRSIPQLFWAALDGSAEAGRQFVNRITVTCP